MVKANMFTIYILKKKKCIMVNFRKKYCLECACAVNALVL